MSLLRTVTDKLRSEKQLAEGHSAWRQGRLATAETRLREILKSYPGSWDAILPLSRVLAEQGHAREALELLDTTESTSGPNEAASVFRGVVHYDSGDSTAARETVEPLIASNLMSGSLLALIDAERDASAAVFPPGGVWLPDVAGRLLSLLEERLFQQDAESALKLHHGFLTGLATPQPVGDASPTSEPEPTSSPGFRTESEWRSELDRLFIAGRHADVCKHYEHPKSEAAWRDADASLLDGFSAIAQGQSRQGLRRLEKALTEAPCSADHHFLAGLAHIRCGERSAAAWCFSRAAGLADTEVHYVIDQVQEALSGAPIPTT